MNENRFICRGKREDTGKWVEGYYVRLDGIDKPLHIIIDRAGQYNRVLPETVGECTGCLDSMGRLIFEGDIVSDINGETHEVEYNAVYGGYFIGQKSDGITFAYIYEIKEPEIIGNVNEVSDERQKPPKAATEEAEAGVQESGAREQESGAREEV